ncbi:MAG: DUF3768 domain-containing protein [Hyphomicrobium sp.]
MTVIQNQEDIRRTISAVPELKQRRIRELNDAFRRYPERGLGVTGKVLMTSGISAMSWGDKASILQLVKSFECFSEGNDPHGEHDFGAFDFKGQKIFWKIDYYAPDMEQGSPDPSNPDVTCRVLTILLADEY